MASLVGQTLGQYQIVAQLGHGGMATVYKAYHARLDRTVAVKMVHSMFVEDKSFLARFEREAQIVARLDHPHIVPVYDFNESHGQPYLVMKFIEGKTLKAYAYEQALSLDDIINLMTPIADALDYAHGQGVLHRDIKPSNILIDGAGVPYLSDFGLARMVKSGESSMSHDILLGTPNYISPEQGQGKLTLTPRTDQYSLGVVLYELVVGQVPFSADTPFAVVHSHIYTPPPPPSSINPAVSPALDAMLMRTLAKQPEDRYESASAMVVAFKAAVRELDANALNAARDASRIEMQRAANFTPSTSPPDDQPTIQTPPPAALPDLIAPDVLKPAAPNTASDTGTPTPAQRVVEVSFDFGSVGQAVRQAGDQVRTAIERAAQNPPGSAPPPIPPSVNADKSKRGAPPPSSESFEHVITNAVEGWFGGGDLDVAAENDQSAARKRIEKQVKKRGEFAGHVVTYIVINIILWFIFINVSAGDLPFNMDIPVEAWAFLWPFVVSMGWGAGLLAHGVETFQQTGKRAARRLRVMRDAYRREFGPDWSRTASKGDLKRVRKIAEAPFKKREEFAQHLVVYVMINIMLWGIFLFASDSILALINSNDPELTQAMGFPWPLFVTFGWGIGLIANAFEALGAGRTERTIEREMERERRILDSEKPKRAARGRAQLPGADEAFGDFDTIEEPREQVREPRTGRGGVRLTEDGELTDSMIVELEDDDERRTRNRRA